MAKTKDMFKIERGVPLPKINSRFSYPFLEMKVGDSFVAPRESQIRVISAASYAGKRNNMKFSIRKIDDTSCRVWRIA